MKHLVKFTSVLFVFFSTYSIQAQTADEIVSTYLENIGGAQAWENVENMVVTGIGRQQGIDYPFVATYMKDGRFVLDVDLQGNSFIMAAFDGKQGWFTNFQTQKAEAADSETSSNLIHTSKDDLVSPFHNYKDKGYKVELLGTETIEGSDLYKIKITKKPLMVNGEEIENVELYYFDKDNMVPISAKVINKPVNPILVGSDEIVYSDYQEVDGKYLAFTQTEKSGGFVALERIIKDVKFNVDVDESIFEMPKE